MKVKAKDKILFVINRYGKEINGGAEDECRELAIRLLPYYDTEILASCSSSFQWNNDFEAGVFDEDGVQVRRFPVRGIWDSERLHRIKGEMLAGKASEQEYLKELGPYCPELLDFLKEHGKEYKAVFFFGYARYIMACGIILGLNNSVLIPTAHDDATIRMGIYRKVFENANAFLFQTAEECELVCERFKVNKKPYRVGVIGIDVSQIDENDIPEPFKKYDSYVIYSGRISDTKRYLQLNRYFIEYKKRNPSDLKLLVIGKKDEEQKTIHSKDIEYLGFVSENEKLFLMQRARFLILPSPNESLSIVCLESISLGRPVLVNGKCKVLKGHCIRSNAGLWYTNYAEFEACMNYLLSHNDEYEEMRRNGVLYVKDNYKWDDAIRNVREIIEEVS